MSVVGQSALILGATGSVGRNILKEVLDSPRFSRVGEFGRRTTALDTDGLNNKGKLIQKVIDYEKPAEAGFKDEKWDVVFVAMGTTRTKTGSLENFIKVDQDYVVEAARAAKQADHKQRLIYVSSGGASLNSWFPYMKSKAQTEDRLASLGYSDTIVFRPAKFLGKDQAEWAFAPLSRVTDRIAIDIAMQVKVLAKSIRIAAELGSSALPPSAEATVIRGSDGASKFTLVQNKGCLRMSETG
ncbi:hypothetical protein JB92DRAFT_3083394 [Gautieria morchelliformis]|nr:hypothetical protein JB92DRAFT_3083394 [Gautieria morchelliformis]